MGYHWDWGDLAAHPIVTLADPEDSNIDVCSNVNTPSKNTDVCEFFSAATVWQLRERSQLMN